MPETPQPQPDTSHPDESSDNPLTQSKTATAYHEAGHAVMAVTLGRSIQKVTISPAQMQSGESRLGACEVQKGQAKGSGDWVEENVLILFSGMVGESHFTQRYCVEGAAQDLRIAKKFLASRARSEKQLLRLERRLLSKTEYILASEETAKAIELIANELIEKETISGRAVKHLIKQAIQQTT
jgi:ATP-dependent Zn protease